MFRSGLDIQAGLENFRLMPALTREVRPGLKPRHVLNEYGMIEAVPADWALLAPGEAALSRRIKLDGPTMTVIELKGRKRFSRGIWAPATRIEALQRELATERSDPAYAKKLESGRKRRAVKEEIYAEDFGAAVRRFLNFHPTHAMIAETMAGLITEHATPVGSGTVARTQRIPLEERARAATVAWLRHQTTGYDRMNIPRQAGRRREVRRMLAQRSMQLLARYRTGERIDFAQCPIHRSLADALPTRTIG